MFEFDCMGKEGLWIYLIRSYDCLMNECYLNSFFVFNLVLFCFSVLWRDGNFIYFIVKR